MRRMYHARMLLREVSGYTRLATNCNDYMSGQTGLKLVCDFVASEYTKMLDWFFYLEPSTRRNLQSFLVVVNNMTEL